MVTRVCIEVTLVKDATAEQAAEQLFEALAADEHDLCPLIETVDGFDFCDCET